MELLDKYLQAVKFWLPSAQQNDIIAELRDDIRSQAEERESALGRSLNENEWEALLKQRGRPLLVAEKYLPPRWLIGPILFPAYWFVLRLALLCYLLPWVGVWIGLVIVNPAYRAQHLGLALFGDILFLFSHAVFAMIVVTIVFAAIERGIEQGKDGNWLDKDWSPRKLPRVRDKRRIPRAKSGAEFIFGTIFGIWWLKILWTLTVFETGGIRVTLPSSWHKFFWPFLGLLILNLSLSAIDFARPYWTRERFGARAVQNLLSAIVFFFVLKDFAPVLAEVPAILPQDLTSLSGVITFGLTVAFAIACVVGLINAFVNTWRALRREDSPVRLNHRVAM